ncbi:unknown [Firmicutes bacterium CAG:791]|nr:unknown [Firmicutes bacterium CAG:791]
MLFPVQNCLIQMRNAPSLRNIVVEQLRQLLRSFSCNRIAPGTKRNKQLILIIKRKIAMHHCADADRGKAMNFRIVFLLHILKKIRIASLQSLPDILQRISPNSIFQPVFPFPCTLGNRNVVCCNEFRLDAGRSEFDSDNRSAFLNFSPDLFLFHCFHPLFICSLSFQNNKYILSYLQFAYICDSSIDSR